MNKTTCNSGFFHHQGNDIYLEIHGSDKNKPVLYLHGGPGESCYDFSYHQANRLSEFFRIIAIDQRGVCRSSRIDKDDSFGLNDIIEDCECLRKQLGIERWSIIGHSFGGYLALLYAAKYPLSIERIIFECPTFDFELTARSLLIKTASLFAKYDQFELQQKCVELARSSKSTRELVEGYMALSDELDEKRMEIYTYNFNNPTDYSLYSEEEWDEFYDRSEHHYDLLRDEGKIFDSLLPKIKEISTPMLLMVGKHDPATCEEHISTFRKEAKNGEVYLFDNCGHTPHEEEADKFAEMVVEFLS